VKKNFHLLKVWNGCLKK